ncbi:MAG: nucleotide exchange factor GrpE [Candidatus Coproplasma sp.]
MSGEEMAENENINREETEEELLEETEKDGIQTEESDKSSQESLNGENAETVDPVLAELAKAKETAEDYKRKWYAVSAEYDNYRKRTQTATSIAYQDGKAEAILKLLPVADTFGYAYDGASDEKTKAGIDKIIKNFNAILLSMGVEEIPLKLGDAFDEATMEAVMNVPCEDGEEPNTVKLILKKGYKREGKVIRFAQVSVTV